MGLLGWIKSVLGSKGTTQIGAGNKSISGVTVGDNGGGIIVGDGNIVHYGGVASKDNKVPLVQVRRILVPVPDKAAGFLDGLAITILNPTERKLFIGNFLLELKDHSTMLLLRDMVTGELQRKRELQAGDRFSFHILRKSLREAERVATDYECAVVEDVVGPPYKSDSTELQGVVRALLKEQE